MVVSLERQIDGLSRVSSLLEAARLLVEIGKVIGLERPGVVEDFSDSRPGLSRDGGPMGEIFGWLRTQFTGTCSESLNDVCPIGRACRVTMYPFVWRAADIGGAPFCWDRRAREFWARAAELDIVGVSVPVHMPMSRVGAVGWLAASKSVDLDAILDTWGAQLRLAAYLFMDQVYRERPRAPGMAVAAALSDRELECLTWVALGKTDAEIGELIRRSPATARFHVNSAVEKLGVNNRTRAAAVASQLGMIRAVA